MLPQTESVLPANAMLIPLPMRPLRGASVALRTWKQDDAEWYVRARDEEIFRWSTERRDLTPDLLRHAIEALLRRPTYAGFAIIDATTRQLLGNISLVISESVPGQAEVSYWLAAQARGRGAATDAVRTMTRWAFECLPINRIELLTNAGNRASLRVARRAGFAPEGERDERLVFAMSRGARKR